MSFMRNPWLPGSRFGVVKRKLRVARNIPMPSALPTAATRGAKRRAAIIAAITSSTTPIAIDAPWTVVTKYNQDMNGLCDTHG
jgi:hypothetical protein